MHPVLFQIGLFTAYSYGFMIALGAILGIFLSEYRAKRRGMDGELIFNACLYGLLAGLLGAKLTYVISHFADLFTDPMSVLGLDGFTVYGGVILGVLVGVWYLKKHNAAAPEILDLVIPQVALAQGFGRIGCFLAGCCYGKPTDSALGVVFPAEAVAPSGVSLWPTQLFSSIGNFLIFGILLLIGYLAAKKGKALKPFTITGCYLCLYGVGRFLVEFFRADPRRMLFGLSSNQYVSFLFLALGLYLILRRRPARSSAERPVRSTAE